MIEQTKTKHQGTLEIKLNKQTQTFSFYLPLNLVEEGKWLVAVSSFECMNSHFNVADENSSFQSLSLYQVIGRPNLMKGLLTN